MTALLVQAAGCYIDFRDGLKCRTNADCDGYSCQSGTCKSSAPSASTGSTGSTGSLAVTDVKLYGDGNGDGWLDPGESASIEVKLSNLGSTRHVSLSGTLWATLAGVTISPAVVQFGTLSGGGAACGQTSATYAGGCGATYAAYLPVISADATVPAGTKIPLRLSMHDSTGDLGTIDFTITMGMPGSVLLADSFDFLSFWTITAHATQTFPVGWDVVASGKQGNAARNKAGGWGYGARLERPVTFGSSVICGLWVFTPSGYSYTQTSFLVDGVAAWTFGTSLDPIFTWVHKVAAVPAGSHTIAIETDFAGEVYVDELACELQ